MKQKISQSFINTLIYSDFTDQAPTRYEMIKYSTWRAYLISELQAAPIDRRDKKSLSDTFAKQFPNLAFSEDRLQFYNFMNIPRYDEKNKQNCRNDNISHFISRMLYCQQQGTQLTFIQVERMILEVKLKRMIGDGEHKNRQYSMEVMKKILLNIKQIDNDNQYDVSHEQWQKMKTLISFPILNGKKNEEYASLYAKIPFQQAQAGIRKRRSFIYRGFVYVGVQSMLNIVLNNYEQFLRKKLQRTKSIVDNLLLEDVQNQFSAFLISTLKQINEQGMEDTKMNGKFNLTLKNIDSLNKYMPPCMLNLNQHLKANRHLRHDGRRQLWGFFKACGMDVHDNKEYFRKHLQGKVTASEMKTHMYNIEHAYGLQGKKKSENAWKCRNIITGTAPKKGQHHGCPFYHWRTQQLGEFLRKNYKVSENHLKQILSQKQQKHFQVACGRLFEYSEINEYNHTIPAQITAKLGKAPYLYYQAGMQLREKKLKHSEGNDNMGMKDVKKSSIDF